MNNKNFPTAAQVAEYVTSQGGFVLRRDISRAFSIKGNDRKLLKDLLRQMEKEGQFERRGKAYRSKISSDLVVVEVMDESPEGDLLAVPIHDREREIYESVRLTAKDPKQLKGLKKGHKVVVKLASNPDGHCMGILVRKLVVEDNLVVGLIAQVGRGRYQLISTDRRVRMTYDVDLRGNEDIREGDLVEASLHRSGARPRAEIEQVLTKVDDLNRKLSKIAINVYDLPQEFMPETLRLAETRNLPKLTGRIDLRDLPLVTIDDIDARDHDDAVYATPDPEDRDGWRIIVAIADVSYFVTPGDLLDREALARGNSVYFPDQVLPMLPERLSNDLCSLKPMVDRPCVAVDLRISSGGKLKSYHFFKGMMKSWGKLTYKDVQAYYDGQPNKIPAHIPPEVIANLYGAFHALLEDRERRGTLDLEIPELKILIDAEGDVTGVIPRTRVDSHKVIEEMMILANVAAAKYIAEKNTPLIYRIHDTPRPEKLEELRLFLEDTSFSIPKGQVIKPRSFMHLLHSVKDTPQSHVINQMVLRSQCQAIYSPENIGHFGLNLPQYCHFTSPIRRYADLIIHRALSHLIDKKHDPYPYELEDLVSISEEISEKERRAAKAERETVDRYATRYLEKEVGKPMTVRVNGITDFAIFVTHEATGADGILPLRNIFGDYFTYDPRGQRLIGRSSGKIITMGDEIDVRLESADITTGSLMYSTSVEGGSKSRKGKNFLKKKKLTKN